MKRILFVSYHHNKSYLADCIQNHRLIKALKPYYRIDVLSKTGINNNETIHSRSDLFIDRIIYKFLPISRSVFKFETRIWARKAIDVVRPNLGNYDYIIIPYEPYSLYCFHLDIFKLIDQNKYNTKIITLLYDPFVKNIFLPKGKISTCIRSIIENKIVKSSAALITNNSTYTSIIRDSYAIMSKSVFEIPLCANSVLRQPNNSSSSSHLKIVHAGNIHGKRNLSALISVLDKLKQQHPNLSELMSIDMYGLCKREDKHNVIKHNLDDIICFKGKVSQDIINNILSTADVLLLIDPMDDNNTCFPSKLCEYYQLNKPIIALAGYNTPSYQSLKSASHFAFSITELDDMVDIINQLIQDKNCFKNRINTKYHLRFSSKYIAQEYVSLLESL